MLDHTSTVDSVSIKKNSLHLKISDFKFGDFSAKLRICKLGTFIYSLLKIAVPLKQLLEQLRRIYGMLSPLKALSSCIAFVNSAVFISMRAAFSFSLGS